MEGFWRSRGSKKWYKVFENLGSTEFLGYDQTESESEIIQ